MMIVATYATRRYAYALPNFGRRLASALGDSAESGTVLFVGDESEEIAFGAKEYVRDVLPVGWDFELLALPVDDTDLKNYKEDAQFLIAQMQSSAFTYARKHSASYFWSIEADVLVPPNALRVLMDCINFDDGYYDIAMCSYPSQGGGAFLGGRGDYRHNIAEDFTKDERKLPKELTDEIAKREKDAKKKGFEPSEEWLERGKEIGEDIKKHPPKDNVFALNAEKWRKRGWMEYAYPAIGKGAIVPTDWVGLGCTMLNRKALSLAHFDGYQGKGTQDLFLGWNRWQPAGLNMAVTTHAICDHVVRERDGEDQLWNNFTHVHAYHEPDGECEGHLRQLHVPHHNFVAGEKHHPREEN